MNEPIKERIILAFRRTMRRFPFFKGPITVCLFLVLIVYRFCSIISHNPKKLSTLAVLIVFFPISCSFCAPVFQFTQEEDKATYTAEYLEGEEIVLATENMISYVPNETTDMELNKKVDNPEVEVGNIEIDNYSVEEILAEHHSNLDKEMPQNTNHEENDWMTILVNKQHPIPDDYEFTLGTITGNLKCDERIIPDLLKMLQAAKNDGISLLICSPYRNLDRQQMLFGRKINLYMSRGMSYMDAYKQSSVTVTIPGSSEHQIGLALDLYTASYTSLDAGFADTKAGIWLKEHCDEYGFILRYPKGKEYITGIEFEPWHFRYVGHEAAQYIMNHEICLEEYIDLF